MYKKKPDILYSKKANLLSKVEQIVFSQFLKHRKTPEGRASFFELLLLDAVKYIFDFGA